jgi:hypothetical protein
MAHPHGLAGQYARIEATRRHQRLLFAAFMLVLFMFLGYGFVWGYFWRAWGATMALVPVVAAGLLMLIGWKYLEPYLDRRARLRIRYMRGGQGEALVAWLLEDLDDDWHIFNGVKLEAGNDHDHVLVGPGGVFCISTKSNRGLFARAGDGLIYNGQPSKFGAQVHRQTMELKDRLTALLGSDVPWIEAVLAVPFGWTEGETRGSKFWLVHQDNIVEQLAPGDGPKKLTPQQVQRVVKAMEMIQESAAEVFERPAPLTGRSFGNR